MILFDPDSGTTKFLSLRW